MPKVGKGVPSPAKFKNIIKDLFQNEKIKYQDDTKQILTFTQAKLNDQQKLSLTSSYPTGSTSLNFYIYYQINVYNSSGNLIEIEQTLVSFIKKNDGFIYGIYFNITNQQSFKIKLLRKSKKSIRLSNNVLFTTSNYIEIYNDIQKNTFILGLSTQNDNIYASLQYSHKSFYFYENLLQNGIQDATIPKTKLTGLSKNLSN